MNSIFAILVVAVLNLVPGDKTTFTMQMNENETIRFTRQADGGWDAVRIPNGDLGTFYVDGAKLTMKGEGKEHTQDLATMLGVNEDTDWKNLKEIKLGAAPVQIQRKADGLDLILKEKNGESEVEKTFTVRWNPDHSVEAMPPSVVSTIPQCGDTAVDPGLKEIRVTFSKHMTTERQWSVCQVSDDTFPEMDGDIHYLGDQRTCVIPVKLQPGRTYVLWFNTGKFNNFRDTAGNPSVPYMLVFETRK